MKKAMRILSAVVLLLLGVTHGKHHLHPRVPIINLHAAEQLTATIREDENVLSTVPDLGILPDTGPICRYEVTSPKAGVVVPFDVQIVDQLTGSAVIKVKDSLALDCKQAEYNLTVTAIRCGSDGAKSEGVPLRVTVKDTNNHAPEFAQPWYAFTVDEGRLYNEITQLTATDADCGHPFGEVCEYEITNGLDNFPFAVSNQGVLRNTRPLNATLARSYILTIVAHDCGMKRSKSVLVTINVKESCVEGVSNMPERISYTPGSGARTLFPDAQTHSCQTATDCEIVQATAVVELKMAHVSGGCSRQNVFGNDNIKNCGLSQQHVSLLPSGDKAESSSSEESSEENEVISEKEKYTFDGRTNAIIVPETSVKALIPDKFTLSFTMKHERGTKDEQNNKQNILCESDDFNMNRHHFSVYIRHCKLEVVLRRESGAAAEFRAAEWRWALPEVCDGEWHSYTLLFNGVDDVNMMIDGKGYRHDERNPEILDDWPLHQTKQQKTRLVVGACWHGRQQQMAQFFHGKISNMHLLVNQVESEEALACAHRCPEQLTFSGSDELTDGESATLDPEQSSLKLNASSTQSLSRMLQRVAYVNSRENPVQGHRQIAVTPQITCKQGKKIELPTYKSYLFVQKQAEPELSISGDSLVAANQHSLKTGMPMLPNIKITVSQTGIDGEVNEITGAKLDWCQVHLKPSRDKDLEYFSSPASIIASMKIDFEHDKEGIFLRGEESVKEYVEVLSKVHYFNTRPESYPKRIYSVQCAMAKGRVKSNEFLVTMSIEAPKVVLPTESPELHTAPTLDVIEKHFEPSFDQLGASRLQNILEMDLPRPKALLSHHGYDMGQGAVAGGAVAVVVVVCVGFLLVLLVIGVLKMRDTPIPKRHPRRQKKNEPGMQWDDEGMNITVNPMEDVEKNGGETITEGYSDDEEESDQESECSFHDDEEMSEDDDVEAEVLPHSENRGQNGLEWDDETIATTRSYRV
ncbi:unnamed protein product, partial [Mesorhabditis belari]|uniref:Cadherin domain-containing protein n=1 Tax=Mesorhabditis belari TaxID=2138241 RepID=A0AAF3EZJ6_9BILA